ncbi:MAG: IclR family transcriptional regulator [Terricaulis sp.]|nr:IclR family transcriptional regulator [Terricaulis sp.]
MTIMQANISNSEREADVAMTLVKGLSVLEVFTPEAPLMGNSEIALRVGLTRPTTARLTRTLALLGYLVYDAGRAKYRLGARGLSLANPLLANVGVHRVARPLMQECASRIGMNLSIGLLSGLDSVYIECVRSGDPDVFSTEIGARLPLARSAIGFALLSMLEPAALSAKLTSLAQQRPDAREVVKAALAQMEKSGFALSKGDWAEHIHGVAVPLMREPETGMYLAINCGAPTFRLRPQQLEREIGPMLVSLAASIRALWDKEKKATIGACDEYGE